MFFTYSYDVFTHGKLCIWKDSKATPTASSSKFVNHWSVTQLWGNPNVILIESNSHEHTVHLFKINIFWFISPSYVWIALHYTDVILISLFYIAQSKLAHAKFTWVYLPLPLFKLCCCTSFSRQIKSSI